MLFVVIWVLLLWMVKKNPPPVELGSEYSIPYDLRQFFLHPRRLAELPSINHVPSLPNPKCSMEFCLHWLKNGYMNKGKCIYLEPVCPLFWGLNPPKEGPFHSKQGSFGFQVNIPIP